MDSVRDFTRRSLCLLFTLALSVSFSLVNLNIDNKFTLFAHKDQQNLFVRDPFVKPLRPILWLTIAAMNTKADFLISPAKIKA